MSDIPEEVHVELTDSCGQLMDQCIAVRSSMPVGDDLLHPDVRTAVACEELQILTTDLLNLFAAEEFNALLFRYKQDPTPAKLEEAKNIARSVNLDEDLKALLLHEMIPEWEHLTTEIVKTKTLILMDQKLREQENDKFTIKSLEEHVSELNNKVEALEIKVKKLNVEHAEDMHELNYKGSVIARDIIRIDTLRGMLNRLNDSRIRVCKLFDEKHDAQLEQQNLLKEATKHVEDLEQKLDQKTNLVKAQEAELAILKTLLNPSTGRTTEQGMHLTDLKKRVEALERKE